LHSLPNKISDVSEIKLRATKCERHDVRIGIGETMNVIKFYTKKSRGKTLVKRPGVDMKIILKRNFYVSMWNGLIWLSIGFNGVSS
jgi:hypothetical protein